jgi:hypothetical protein
MPTPPPPPATTATKDAEGAEAPSVKGSLFGSLRSKWRQISDAQRISRLQQCQALHDILSECRHRNADDQQRHNESRGRELRQKEREVQTEGDATTTTTTSAATAETPTIETTPAGIRMLHYFQWRNLEAEEGGASVLGDARRLCTREEHALWACRAVATACGPDLIQVKRCFDETGPSILQHAAAYDKLSTVPSTSEQAKVRESRSAAWSASSPPGRVPMSSPCVDVQRSMGSCVARGIDGLNQRIAEDKI